MYIPTVPLRGAFYSAASGPADRRRIMPAAQLAPSLKNWRPRRRPKNFGLFLVQNQDFSGGNYFFDLLGSEIFDIYKSAGVSFR